MTEICNRSHLTLVCRTREAVIEWCKQVGLLTIMKICPKNAEHGQMRLYEKVRGLGRFRCRKGDCQDVGTEISIAKGTIFEEMKLSPEKAVQVLYSFAYHDSYETCRREAIQIDENNSPMDQRLSDETIADW